MKTTYLFIALLVTLLLNKPCIADDATGSDVRAVLNGKYALTSEGYAKYQKCISSISLGAAIQEYAAEIESCKNKAKETAYTLPVEPEHPNMSPEPIQQNPSIQMQQDRAWQFRKLDRSK